MMVEIDDAIARAKILRTLAGVEETAFIDIGGTRIKGTPTEYEDRTTPDGKTSSVHWIRFKFQPELISAFRAGFGDMILGLNHQNYRHMAVFSEDIRKELSRDFD